MKNKQLKSRLAGYSATAAAMAAITANVDAQIVSSGPLNIIVNSNENVSIDLNNDGIKDFIFQINRQAFGNENDVYARIFPVDNVNGWNVFSGKVNDLNSGYKVRVSYPSHFKNISNLIGSFRKSLKTSNSVILTHTSTHSTTHTSTHTSTRTTTHSTTHTTTRGTSRSTTHTTTYSGQENSNVHTNFYTNTNPHFHSNVHTHINTNIHTNTHPNIHSHTQIIRRTFSTSNSNGFFPGRGPKYLGVDFKIGTEMHAGWIKINVANDCSQINILEYAYEKTPNTFAVIGSDGTPVSSIEKSDDLKIYPNPAKRQVNIKTANNSEFKLLNLFGETILTGTLKAGENEIFLDQIKSGNYIIQTLSNGKMVTNKLVIIK